MQIKVVIPSKGRHATMISHKYVSNCIVCVAESELGIYKEHNPNVEYETHPDSVIGLARKREWIYERFKNVFMMDDDLKGLSRLTAKKGERSTMSPELTYDIIQNCGNIAKMCGCYLFCFNSLIRPVFYSGHSPFRMSGCINGAAFGILEGADKLKMDHSIKLAYEWYISGINAYYYRMMFIDNRFCINHPSYEYSVGGASNQRTVETEKSDLRRLVECFGNALHGEFRDNKGGKNQFAKRLKIPF